LFGALKTTVAQRYAEAIRVRVGLICVYSELRGMGGEHCSPVPARAGGGPFGNLPAPETSARRLW
jgi:hypothetical protein